MANDNSPFTQKPKQALMEEEALLASKIAANPEAYAKAMDDRIEDKAILAKHENESGRGAELDTKIAMQEILIKGKEGVPMTSIEGATIHFNKDWNNAQVVNKDGSTIDVMGKDAIKEFADEHKLTAFETKTLNEFDDLGNSIKDPDGSIAKGLAEYIAEDEKRLAALPKDYVEVNEKYDPNAKLDLTENIILDQATKDRLAEARARDNAEAQKSLNSNIIERAIAPEVVTTDNKVESDEMFIARKADVKPIIPPEIEQQYLKVGDKYHYAKSPDAVAFEDKGNKLETKSNSNNVAESMVRIAAARGWDEIKVSGSETFRKEAWLEAASRGMAVKGYTPNEQDKNELAQRGKDLEANKIEKDNQPFRGRENDKQKEDEKQADKDANKELAKTFKDKSPTEVVKLHPELAGAVAAVAVMEKRAEADGLNAQQRAIVSARLRENVANSIERGNIPEVKMREEIEVKRDIKVEREAQR